MAKYEKGLYLSQIYNKTDNKNVELKTIDIDEFRDLQIEDYSVYDNITNNNYNNIFKFETNSGDYSLHFEKVLYHTENINVEVEYVIFRAINYIFKDEYTPTYNNLLIYDIDEEHTTLTLIEEEDIIQNLLEENQLLEYIDGLKVIDIDEFKELNIDYSILECIKDDNYNGTFKFETISGQNFLLFEKILHHDGEYFKFVIFKPLNHIFIEEFEMKIPNNFIIYSFDDETKLTLIDEEDVILDIIQDYYYNPESEVEDNSDYLIHDESNNDSYDDSSTANDDYSYDETINDEDDIYNRYYSENDDLYGKLFDDNFNGSITSRSNKGQLISFKKIGKVEYKKNTYFIMQLLCKFLEKEKDDYIVYQFNKGEESSSLDTVYDKKLHKKIIKIYSKKHKVKLK